MKGIFIELYGGRLLANRGMSGGRSRGKESLYKPEVEDKFGGTGR